MNFWYCSMVACMKVYCFVLSCPNLRFDGLRFLIILLQWNPFLYENSNFLSLFHFMLFWYDLVFPSSSNFWVFFSLFQTLCWFFVFWLMIYLLFTFFKRLLRIFRLIQILSLNSICFSKLMIFFLIRKQKVHLSFFLWIFW